MADNYCPTPAEIASAAAAEKSSKLADVKARQAADDRRLAAHQATIAKPVQATRNESRPQVRKR